MASLRARSYLAILFIHRWLGLILGLVVIVVSVTGALLIVPQTLQNSFQAKKFLIEPGVAPKPMNELMANVAVKMPAAMRIGALRIDDDPRRVWQVVLVDTVDRRRRIYANVNPYSGELVSFQPQEAYVDRWMRLAHYTLFAGPTGNLLSTVTSAAFVIFGVTGVWIYRGALAGLWRSPFRLRLGWKTALTDLHKWLGVASLVLCVIWGVTGVIIMLQSFLPASFSPLRDKPERVNWTPAQSTPLEPLLRQTMARFPGTEVLSVGMPATRDGLIVFYLLHREAPFWRKSVKSAFRADTGALFKFDDATGKTFWQAVQDSVSPLHFGTFGGPTLKWIYFIGAWATVLLSVTGYVIWILGWRKDRGKVQRNRRGEARA